MCMFGYNVANSATNYYSASDFVHRLLHIPQVGEGTVEHYNDEEEKKYPGVMALAKDNSTYAARNSDSLQYFALEAYAHDIAVPGIGCAGTYTPIEESSTAAATSNASAVASASASEPPAAANSTAAAAATSSAAAAPAEACEPHNDHW
jgi:hypothetical protein